MRNADKSRRRPRKQPRARESSSGPSGSEDDEDGMMELSPRRTIVSDPTVFRVRIANDPISPPRRTAENKIEYRKQCFSEAALLSSRDNDCGCCLTDIGCYKSILAFALAQRMDGMSMLLRCRTRRFDISHDSAFRTSREDLCSKMKATSTGDAVWFVYSILGERVCRKAYCFLRGIPDRTLADMEKDAERGVVETRWNVARVIDARIGDGTEARAFAAEHVKLELTDLSEEQPNVAPYYDKENDCTAPQRHMDKVVVTCGQCKAHFTNSKPSTDDAPSDGGSDGASGGPPRGDVPPEGAESGPCGGHCRYAVYRLMCSADEIPALQTSSFRQLYYETMSQEHVTVRHKKGVSSDCRTCDDCNTVIALRATQRTDAEFKAAKRKLGKHIAVIRRLRGWERSMQLQSRRQMRLRLPHGVLHAILDKAVQLLKFNYWECLSSS